MSVRDANAERGWGWLYPQSNASMIGVCSAPNDASLRFKLRDAVTHGTVLTGNIEVKRRGVAGTVNFFGASNVVVTCYDPAKGYEIKVTGVSGYRNFWSGQVSNAPAADRGQTQRRFVYLVKKTGNCKNSCPSVQSVSPSGSGPFQWFSGNPPSWRVKVRELPNQSGPTGIQDFLLNLVQQTNCSGPCFVYGNYIDRTNFVWAADDWRQLEHNITSKTNSRLGTLPSGKYAYIWLLSENGGGAWDPDSAFGAEECFCNWDEFGVDRIDPVDGARTHRKQSDASFTNPDPVEDTDKIVYQVKARDSLSGLREIKIQVRQSAPSFTAWVTIKTCSYSTFPITTQTCTSSLQGPYAPNTTRQYRLRSLDQVNNDDFSPAKRFDVVPSVKPWLRTTLGNIGALGLLGFLSIHQDRDPANPSQPRTTANYLIFAAGVASHITSTFDWILAGFPPSGYPVNMEKFPQPSAGNSIYDTLFQKHSRRCVEDFSFALTATNIKDLVNTSGCNVLRYTPSGEAVLAGAWGNYDGKPVIIFFPNSGGGGNPVSLKINDEIKIANKTGVIFVTRADINVKNIVDRIDGFFITDRRFVTDRRETTSPPDDPLVINGSVISFYSGGINWRRDGYGRNLTSNANKTIPAEKIIFQPKYLWLFADTLGDSRTIFRELPP